MNTMALETSILVFMIIGFFLIIFVYDFSLIENIPFWSWIKTLESEDYFALMEIMHVLLGCIIGAWIYMTTIENRYFVYITPLLISISWEIYEGILFARTFDTVLDILLTTMFAWFYLYSLRNKVDDL